MKAAKNFREDINGLRALAVLAVLVFHFSSDLLPGGFAGVDIFFVISGYLMTAIIVSRIESESFSLFEFYAARARRIVPPLLSIAAITLAVGYVFFEPLTYQIMGKHALSSILFFSNITYLNEAGYFDQASHDKFLLHTWSLSVEWQFYLLLPIFIMLLSKLTRKSSLRLIFLAATTILFIVNIFISKTDPTASYFTIQSRAWEMMLGGVVFLFPMRLGDSARRTLEVASLTAIIGSFQLIKSEDLWPGYMALLPTLATCALLWANPARSLLSITPIQRIGLWSYSIYLIHWPVIVFAKQLNLTLDFVVYVAITISAACLLHRVIETKRPQKLVGAVSFVAVGAACLIVMQEGVPSRVDQELYKLTLREYRKKYEGHARLRQIDEPHYLNTRKDDFEYILIGDSNARHYLSYILEEKIKLVTFALDGCYSSKNYVSKPKIKQCVGRYQMQIDFIKKHPGKKVLIAYSWDGVRKATLRPGGEPSEIESIAVNELAHLIKDSGSDANNYYLISKLNTSPYTAFTCLSKGPLPIYRHLNIIGCDKFSQKIDYPVNKQLEEYAKTTTNVHFVDTAEPLCGRKGCLNYDSEGTIYTDTQHLTKHGARLVGSYLFGVANPTGEVPAVVRGHSAMR